MKEGVQVQVIKLIKKGGKNTRIGCVISEKKTPHRGNLQNKTEKPPPTTVDVTDIQPPTKTKGKYGNIKNTFEVICSLRTMT